MKKILKRTFLGFLILIVAAFGGGYYYLFGMEPDDPTENFVVDNLGTTYYSFVGDDGGTYVVVPDEDGNRLAAEFKNGQVGKIVGNVNSSVKPEELPTNHVPQTPTGNTDKPVSPADKNDVTTTTSSSQQENKPTKPAQNGEDKTTKPAEQPKDPQALEAYRVEKLNSIIASGTFLMETVMDDTEMGETPVLMAIKNGNTYVETSMSMEGINIDCKMIYQASTDTTYLIIDNWKKYTKISAEMMGDTGGMDVAGELQAEFANEDLSDIKVSKVKVDGKELILESYNSGGNTINYYFDGDQLVRRDDITADGVIVTTEYVRFSGDVPDSYFEIPDDYSYLNLSWLEKLAGSVE